MGLLDDLSGGGGAIGEGGHHDVDALEGLVAALAGQVVVAYATKSSRPFFPVVKSLISNGLR